MSPDARDLRIEDYDYPLPDERIARHPLEDRQGSKLLRYANGSITDHRFADLPDLLPPGTLVIGNQTRVIHARLHFPLRDGKNLEIFCLEPLNPADYARSLGSTASVRWKCLIGGNRRWKSGSISRRIEPGGLTLTAERGERRENAFEVTFSWEGGPALSFGEVLEAAGTIPLPPYLGRPVEAADRNRYQTVFAEREGSVAAPTAGLHFTPGLMEQLAGRGIDFRTLTLHVGAGTFKPVTSPSLSGHVMHREFFTVDRELLEVIVRQLQSGRPVVSVGTTSMRCLESLFYLGHGVMQGQDPAEVVDQWVAGESGVSDTNIAPAFSALADHLARRQRSSLEGYTRLLLSPGSRPRVVDGLITNFHQPRSTLLLLVAAMIGSDWQRVYRHALEGGYRFLSYGDSSLLWRRRGAGAEQDDQALGGVGPHPHDE